MRSYRMITAYSFQKMGLGNDNKMCWKIPDDLKRFKEKTSEVFLYGDVPVVIMGRKTWESLPSNSLPKLKNRLNIVITNNKELHLTSGGFGTLFCSFDALNSTLDTFENDYLKPYSKLQTPYIIGGGQLYKLALQSLDIERIDVTEVYLSTKCDAFFPEDLMQSLKFGISDISTFYNFGDVYYRYITFTKHPYQNRDYWRNTEEVAYLYIMKEITSSSIELPRTDRTGVGTHSIFGQHLTYDLSDTFPISTTRKMFLRGIFEELMMYLRGQTNNKILNDKGINVWDGNTTREFLDARGLTHYNAGDMGSTYGFNFRHFGAQYNGCDADYTGKGCDQLQDVITLLKTDPESRRIIINLWNPEANKGAALPSCLCMYQFYVRKNEYGNFLLDLQIYIRSSDYFLANNWNTCTGALFVHLLCSLNGLTHLTPGKLSVCMGDAHVYTFHKEQVIIQLSRDPYPFPKLVVETTKDNIEDFEFSDLKLFGYKHYPGISGARMAV